MLTTMMMMEMIDDSFQPRACVCFVNDFICSVFVGSFPVPFPRARGVGLGVGELAVGGAAFLCVIFP